MDKNRQQQKGSQEPLAEKRPGDKVTGKAKKEMENLQVEEERTNLTLRRRVAYFLLSIFALNAVGTLAVVFLVGFGQMALSNTIIISLIGETVAHAATMFITVTKYLFPMR